MQAIDYERAAPRLIRDTLNAVPFLKVSSIAARPRREPGRWKPDLLLEARAGNERWRLVCEVKAAAQPRHVRFAALQLKDYLARFGKSRDYPVLVASYLSRDSAALCAEQGIGYVDFAGNCRLNFGRVYIERAAAAKPSVRRRELRSLFGAKSTRVLRVLLREPAAWKVVDLATVAQVSLGQVSSVRKALLDREWAEELEAGLRLRRPRAVLEAWREASAGRRVQRARYHCLLHGEALNAALREALAEAGDGRHAVLASFSAASWLAPYARVATQYLYADAHGESILARRLRLQPVAKGENLVVDRPADDGVFFDRVETAPGMWCTAPAQTFVDLALAGERGEEAADHLYEAAIAPAWSGVP
jgi:hypothetical protein